MEQIIKTDKWILLLHEDTLILHSIEDEWNREEYQITKEIMGVFCLVWERIILECVTDKPYLHFIINENGKIDITFCGVDDAENYTNFVTIQFTEEELGYLILVLSKKVTK